MEIGMLEAKTHLSGLVDRALAGEEVIVTRHGRALVRLVPVQAEPAPSPQARAVEDLLRFMDGRAAQPTDVVQLIREVREERVGKRLP